MRAPPLVRAALVACALAVSGCGDGEEPARDAGGCERFCASVAPARGDTETVFRFSGRGWIPGREVTATYGVYCPPRRVCIQIAKQSRFRADGEGRFAFHFRNGRRPPARAPRPRDHGGGPVTFRQRTGPPGSGEFVARAPRYFVDGRPLGGSPGP